VQKLETIQGKIIKSIWNVPNSTPYYGILKECGIWPIEDRINERKLMWYHNLLNSKDKRLAKIILITQMKTINNYQNWYTEIRTIANVYKINISKEKVTNTSKDQWKKAIKKNINEYIKHRFSEKKGNMKKLRFLSNDNEWKIQNYIKDINLTESRTIMLIRLNMIKVGANYGVKSLCPLCDKSEDTTEHLIACNSENVNINTTMIESSETRDLIKIKNVIEKQLKKREICL